MPFAVWPLDCLRHSEEIVNILNCAFQRDNYRCFYCHCYLVMTTSGFNSLMSMGKKPLSVTYCKQVCFDRNSTFNSVTVLSPWGLHRPNLSFLITWPKLKNPRGKAHKNKRVKTFSKTFFFSKNNEQTKIYDKNGKQKKNKSSISCSSKIKRMLLSTWSQSERLASKQRTSAI